MEANAHQKEEEPQVGNMPADDPRQQAMAKKNGDRAKQQVIDRTDDA